MKARLRTALLALAALVLAIVPAMGQTATAAPPAKFSYSASAFGTSMSVGSTVRSGQSALASLGCTTAANLDESNRTAGTNLSPVGTAGAVTTRVQSFATPIRSLATATTSEVNLLNGLVRASTVRARSYTTRSSSGALSTSAFGTTFTGLRVAGNDIQADAAPNTRINLAGLGYVIVNEQVRRSNGLTVTGLHLVVTASNSQGVPVGTDVKVSQAVSALSGPVAGVLSGRAYGSYAVVGTAVLSGPTFKATMPCLGTGGQVRTNEGAGVSIPDAATTGTISNSVKGTVTATSASGEAVSTVQAADLLDGLVTASAIKASARASSNGSDITLSDAGSGFGSLQVTGQPNINADVAANTRVTLEGVGTLYLRRTSRTSSQITVTMIQLVLTRPVNGLAVGTDIRVAVATAAVG